MGDKISVILCRQSKAVCSGAETIPGGLSLPEIYCRSTWNGLELIDLNSFRSASVARASNDGKSASRKPHLRSPFRRRSSLFRCFSVAYPHHAGEAYCREATVVALVTRCNSWERRPCDLSVRRANFEDAHDETAQSMWSLIDSCGVRSTPSTFNSSTRLAPGMIGSTGGWTRVERRWPTTIIFFVVDG